MQITKQIDQTGSWEIMIIMKNKKELSSEEVTLELS